MDPLDGDAGAWAAQAPLVPEEWFVRPSRLHGVAHTQRVHIHAQRLMGQLGWDQPDTELVLRAVLWHDIGRTNDGEDRGHGAQSAARAEGLGLSAALPAAARQTVLFAMRFHCLSDEEARSEAPRLAADGRLTDPHAALQILWLLKDADALDRVRLLAWEAADPRQLRHPQTAAMLPFAEQLYRALR